MMDRWIPYDDPDWNAWECSACGAVQYLESGTPLENGWLYCPHCGKPMNHEELVKLGVYECGQAVNQDA